MADYKDLLSRLLDATDDGRRILTDLLSDAIIKGNVDKKFAIRDDDNTPSATLCPPNPKFKGIGWHIRDFGKRGGWYSAVDFYMLNRGYSDDQFMLALHELAEMYGISDKLNPKVNVRHTNIREASPEEMNQPPQIEFFDSFDGINLGRVFIPKVKPEHLETYGWRAVKRIAHVKNGQYIEITADPSTYPVFAQECHYTDEQGNDQFSHYKIYEPFNPKKEYRFWSIGDVPSDYMYGRDALMRCWRKGGEKTLSVVLVVSGGSDAISALSYGYPSIWFNSETRQIKPNELDWLKNYCKRVVYVADIDTTGVAVGKTLSLSLPTLYVAWIDPKELGGLHDARGRLRKDLKDYLTLHPLQKDMDRLITGAKCAQFWKEIKSNNSEKVSYTISEASLVYFLWLNGYCQLKDANGSKPRYIHIENGIVTPETANSIHDFLKGWCERMGISEGIQNQLLKSLRSMITDTTGHLKMCDDLDFSCATATSGIFYFANSKVTVTAQKITHQPYSVISDGLYVWRDNVIKHTYRPMNPQFTWEKDDDGRYHITIASNAPSKLLRIVLNMARLHWRKEDELYLDLTNEEMAEQEQCLVTLFLTIGYLLHRHKSPSAAYAPLFLDYAISDNPKDRNGRSGKTFLLKAVGNLLNKLYIDMQQWAKKSNQQFSFAGVKESTGIIIIDECPEDFAFAYLYSKITDDLEVERKKENPIVIPFSQSPKFGIATNHTLSKHDPSTFARFAPVVVSDYYHVQTSSNSYNETRTIYDEFSQNLLDNEYPECDWQPDIHFMLECLQMYLSLPVTDRRQMPPMAHIERRELQASIYKDFRQWADENLAEGSEWLDRKVRADELLNAYNQDTRYNCSPKSFTEQLKKWCQYAEHINCYNPASCTGQKNDGDRWQVREGDKRVNYYFLQTKAAADTARDSETTQTDLFTTTEELPF